LTGARNQHRFALLTASATFLLIIAGGLVTSTGSGLSVPDWPTTYGHFMFAFPLDQMVGGIVFEHTHRMIASVVGFLTVILAIWIWKRDDRAWVKKLGLAAVFLVVAQGVLGGLTVLLLLPPAVSVAHAALAQSFFAVVASLALFTSSWWRSLEQHPGPALKSAGAVRLTVVTAAAVFIQLLIGALMRHTDSGLAVPDFPLAYGQIIPSLSASALQGYNDQLLQSGIRIAADGPVTAGQIAVHMIHRFWAVLVLLLVAWTSTSLARESVASPRLRRFAFVLAALTLTQIALGAFTVLSGKSVLITTAHVATGALLLVFSVLASLHTIGLRGVRQMPAPVLTPGSSRASGVAAGMARSATA
jgi:cytochrome c oxidase assembly protein subunit 15